MRGRPSLRQPPDDAKEHGVEARHEANQHDAKRGDHLLEAHGSLVLAEPLKRLAGDAAGNRQKLRPKLRVGEDLPRERLTLRLGRDAEPGD
jgi:hypothetical protein